MITINPFVYPSFDNDIDKKSQCKLDIWKIKNGKLLVMFTELSTNTGPSITNFAEGLATNAYYEVLEKLFEDIKIQDLIFIEHYNKDSYKDIESTETFKLVNFTIANEKEKKRGILFKDPKWQPVDIKDYPEV